MTAQLVSIDVNDQYEKLKIDNLPHRDSVTPETHSLGRRLL